MKVAFFEIKGWEKPFLKKNLRGHDLMFFKEPFNIENLNQIKSYDAISVFIYSEVTKKLLEKLPKLKLITTRSTGYDHIDLATCKKKGITVCNVPFYGENTVAEHTFALILSLSRNVHKSYVRTTHNNFSIEGLEGFDLKGKTIGIIGAGNIGQHVIRIAKGFGMEVIAYDTAQKTFLAEVLGYQYVSLEELLKSSHIISLHVPYNQHTHHLINRKNISLIKKGALLINTARGAVVETDALIEALDKGILAGAGLDVLEGEELIKEEKQLLYDPQKLDDLGKLAKDYILFNKDNVVFTPHMAFYSHEALERILETTVQNTLSFFSKNPQNALS